MTPADVPTSTAPFFVTMMPKISKQISLVLPEQEIIIVLDSSVYQVLFAALADEEGKFYRRHY